MIRASLNFFMVAVITGFCAGKEEAKPNTLLDFRSTWNYI
jgi:hypothetical protein